MKIALVLTFSFAAFQLATCYTPLKAGSSSQHSRVPAVMTSKSIADERRHIEHHMRDAVGHRDINQMAEEELGFLYFKMHDNDNNNKLDGCELVKSLLHWHVEEHKSMAPDTSSDGTTRIFGHDELSMMIDPILSLNDKNLDGFIDYAEFVKAHKTLGF